MLEPQEVLKNCFIFSKYYPPWNKQQVCTWKWMVGIIGIRLFPFGMAYLQGRTVSFRWCTWFYLGLSPLPVIVEMKVYRDSLLKMWWSWWWLLLGRGTTQLLIDWEVRPLQHIRLTVNRLSLSNHALNILPVGHLENGHMGVSKNRGCFKMDGENI